MPQRVGMQGTSRILSFGIVVREIVLSQDLPSAAEDRMRHANGGLTRGWNESKRGEVNAKGYKRHRDNPNNGSHGLTIAPKLNHQIFSQKTKLHRLAY